MRNIDKIARSIAKNGAKNLLIYTVPGTRCWLLCEKIEADKWIMSLCNPMGYSIYNLGTVNTKQHLDLWTQLIHREIDIKADMIARARELRHYIRNFLKSSNTLTAID